MRLAVQRLGPDLGYLPDGETGVRRNWVIGMIEGFRSHPDLRLVKDGDWSDYDKTPRFALQPGHRLYGAALDLGITAAARAAMSEFDTQCAALADGTQPGPLVGHPVDVSTQPRTARARRGPGRDGPHQAPARRPAGRMTRPSSGHDHFRAGVNFRKQARVLPVRPPAVARRCPGQLEALHLRARP
jgi:hypothetical protein